MITVASMEQSLTWSTLIQSVGQSRGWGPDDSWGNRPVLSNWLVSCDKLTCRTEQELPLTLLKPECNRRMLCYYLWRW